MFVCALATANPAPVLPKTSFTAARERVFAHPLSEPEDAGPVPELGLALSARGVLKAFARIVKDPADFRDDSPKVVHRYGVCADAVWDMDVSSNATGLFSYGTRIPALVRMATGTNRTVHAPLAGRTWGLAIKLFPSPNPDQPVVTRNLVLFDQYGLDGQARPHFLQPLTHDPPVYFTNHIRAEAPTSKVAGWVLGRFDDNPLFRSLVPLADVTMNGDPVFLAQTPTLVHLHPRFAPQQVGRLPADYRDELRAYPPGSLVFDVVLPPQPLSPQLTRVGTLTVNTMVLSAVCDGPLHFWHPPVP